MQNLVWISDLHDPSKILVVSVISLYSPRSPSYHWLRKSVQDLRWTSDLKDHSKTLDVSVNTEIRPRSSFFSVNGEFKNQFKIASRSVIAKIHPSSRFKISVRSVVAKIRPQLGWINDRKHPSKLLVGSVTSMIPPRSWLYQRSRISSKIFVVLSISDTRPRSQLSRWSSRSVQNLGWISDLEDKSKISVTSVFTKISSRSRSGQWSRRSVQNFVGPVISKITPRLSCLGERQDPSQILVFLGDLKDQFKIASRSVIAKIHPSSRLSW